MAASAPACFTKPSVARVCDALLDGRDNYAADRELAGRLREICPSLPAALRENRAFITRAVTWAARQGVRQYCDLGTGMPAQPPAGDAARTAIPSARVAYVDSDPIVTAHVRAQLAAGDETAAVEADLADPAAVLAQPALRAVIDLNEPVCLIFGQVLSLMPARQVREIVAAYADLVAPGSFIAVSCGRVDDEGLWKELSAVYAAAADAYNHSQADVEGFLAALEIVPPGLVAAQNWRGGWHDVPLTPPGPAYVLAGVARKP